MRKIAAALAVLLAANSAKADHVAPKDSTRVVDIEEVVVIASPKETSKLRQLPASVSLISQQQMRENRICSIKDASSLVPNFFMPDYGSRLTSAIYIRGIGARINTPAVGLYVDNIPYIDKSAFDFNFYDIERIDILRGPQGTLYGRNTMGGLVKVHTRSPFDYQGTDLKLGAGTYNNYNASLTHYHRISSRFAFSVGGFYEHEGGYFENTYLHKKADRLNAGGGRVRAIWLPNSNLKFDFTVGYEYNKQGGYPYGKYDPETGKTEAVAYNDPSSYRRGLLNAGLNIEYQGRGYIFSAVTGYQNLDDQMKLDQDFTPRNVYTIEQDQKLNAITEEIIFKSNTTGNWQWVTGAFGFYQSLNTDGPVTFKDEGVQMLQNQINGMFPPSGTPMAPQMKLTFTQDRMYIPGSFKTPVVSGAVYHQSTYNNLFVKGLSVTAGLRLEYEKTYFDYNSGTDVNSRFSFSMPPMVPQPIVLDLNSAISFKGKTDNSYLQLLPKFALKYDFDKQNNIYASVSKGYRSGGYNLQMFSDLIESALQADIKTQIKNGLEPKMIAMGLPEAQVEKMLAMLNAGNLPDAAQSTVYKPEYSWNYEIGAHLSLFENRLWADVAAFYMDTRDQQVARFAESGLGRMTVNAGRSRSIGAEASLRASITSSLSLNAAYGYTHAKFTDYTTNDRKGNPVDYKDNYVPLVPQNTVCVGAQYVFRFKPSAAVRNVTLDLRYNGAGKIYYTEDNSVSQDFYGTLNARASMLVKGIEISIWGKNLLDKSYTTFYFETIGQTMAEKAGFMQRGKPFHCGIDLRYQF